MFSGPGRDYIVAGCRYRTGNTTTSAHTLELGHHICSCALSGGGTTIAYIFYYWLIDHVGPTRTLIVTYLLPCMALVYGTLLLHEAVGLNSIAGLILILTGVFLTGKSAGRPQGSPHWRQVNRTR